MAVTAGQLATAFSLAQVVLLFATAAFVWTLAPQSLAKRLLALLLALRGAAQVGDFLGQIDGPSQAAAYWFFVDMGLLHALALGAFAAIYPSRVRWRSAAGVLLALALGVFLAQAAALTFARAAFYRTTAGDALFWLYVAGFGLAGLSCVLRFPELPARERRPASLVAFVLAGSTVAVPAYQVVLEAVAFGRTGTLLEPSPYPGAAPWLPPILYAMVAFAVLPAVAFGWYRRERHPIVPLVLAYGLATVPFAFFAGMPYYFFTILEAIVVLHLFARHPAMGVMRVPTGRATAMAVLAGAALFFAIVALALANFGDSSLSLAGGTLAGLVLGGSAFVATLPREHLPVRDDREEATRRLSAYGIALERELRAGRSPEEAGAALADLRAALRVSDDEHAALVSTRAPAAVGDALLIGRYRPLRVLGEGGGGVTRLCLDERVGREVVLKSLRGDDPSPERISVLLREARAVGSIKHPNVITLHDVVDSGREAIIVMEHAERGSLRDALKRGPLAPSEWRRVAEGLLRALEAVHGAGVVHRDVKPSNILIAADGTPKLADFGIAHVPGFETTVGGLRDAAVGTFRYMSPEQAKGRPANARSDLFSAAATLYEAFTGQPYLEPRVGESAVEVQMRAASGRAFDRDLEPVALRAWFARALDPEASQRFATARDAREALEAALAEDPLR